MEGVGSMYILALIVATFVAVLAVVVLLYREHVLKEKLSEQDIEVRRRRYELAVLQNIGSRIGSELNVENILALVTESLEQFVDYAVVSHVLMDNDSYVFTANLKKPVSKDYITSLQSQSIKSLEVLLDKEIDRKHVLEKSRGVFMLNEAPKEVRSYFNIPIIIEGVVYGILTVSHFKPRAYDEESMTILYKIIAQATQAVTKIEEVVKTEQSKLGNMIESMNDGVLMVDRAFRVIVINSVARDILGIDKKEDVLFDTCVEKIGDPYDIRGFLEDSMVQDRVITTREVKIGEKYFKIIVSPVKGEGDVVHKSVLGGVVMFHDVSTEKEAEKLRDSFTSFMVHELRSPLDGIKKVSEMMHDEKVRKNKMSYDEYVKMIHRASSQMLELVNDLLDVTRLENGSLDLSPRDASVRDVVGGRIRFFEITAHDKEIEISSSVSERVPETCKMDPIRIEQVLNNLLSNAIKYTNEGGSVVLHVFMHEKGKDVLEEAAQNNVHWHMTKDEAKPINDDGSAIVFAVVDDGEGIDVEAQKKLFRKFDRKGIMEQNHKNKSLGLGLVIVRGIIERHGGVVGVASRKTEGSTFYFTINV